MTLSSFLSGVLLCWSDDSLFNAALHWSELTSTEATSLECNIYCIYYNYPIPFLWLFHIANMVHGENTQVSEAYLFLYLIASSRQFKPSSLRRLTSPPFSIKIFKTFSWPFTHAKCKAVSWNKGSQWHLEFQKNTNNTPICIKIKFKTLQSVY